MKLLKTMTLSYMYPVNLVGGGNAGARCPLFFIFSFWGRGGGDVCGGVQLAGCPYHGRPGSRGRRGGLESTV